MLTTNLIIDVMNSFNAHATKFAEILLHFLWPVNCPVCGKPSEIICPECMRLLFADKIINKKVESLEIFSASYYHTNINKLISEFKYSGYRALCRPLGQAMAKFFIKPNVDYLVPVPLHLKSKRNYNQALEITKAMSEIWDIEIFHGIEWSNVMPNRAGLNMAERMRLKSDSFIIPENIHGLNIALIDDVCTTGMTLVRLAQACENKGAHVVGAYTLATVSE